MKKNNTFNIRRMVNETIVPSTQRHSVLNWRLSDFYLGPYKLCTPRNKAVSNELNLFLKCTKILPWTSVASHLILFSALNIVRAARRPSRLLSKTPSSIYSWFIKPLSLLHSRLRFEWLAYFEPKQNLKKNALSCLNGPKRRIHVPNCGL